MLDAVITFGFLPIAFRQCVITTPENMASGCKQNPTPSASCLRWGRCCPCWSAAGTRSRPSSDATAFVVPFRSQRRCSSVRFRLRGLVLLYTVGALSAAARAGHRTPRPRSLSLISLWIIPGIPDFSPGTCSPTQRCTQSPCLQLDGSILRRIRLTDAGAGRDRQKRTEEGNRPGPSPTSACTSRRSCTTWSPTR